MEVLLTEFKQLLMLMKKHHVEFMLVGGYAVIYYGYERTTTDMDIWLQGKNKNRDNLINALKEFGIGEESLSKLKNIDFTKTEVFYFGNKPRRIDFLTKIRGVEFEEAIKQVNYFQLTNIEVPVIHYHHLIINKMLSSRLKDKADVEELQKINKYRKEK
jgi:hypothetical protein